MFWVWETQKPGPTSNFESSWKLRCDHVLCMGLSQKNALVTTLDTLPLSQVKTHHTPQKYLHRVLVKLVGT